MSSQAGWLSRHRISAFVVLSFGLSWWPWPLAVAHRDSVAMLSFGPLVAALLVIALTDGRSAVQQLARSVVSWRAPRSTWAVAAAGPFGLAALAGVLAHATGIAGAPNGDDALGWPGLLAVPLVLLTTGLLGGPLFEEIGWRGFLLPELQRGHPALWSTAVVGVLWLAWHLPLLITEPTGQRPPLPLGVWILAQAVLLTWLYNATSGSVLIAIVFHTAANTAGRLLLEPFVGEPGFLGVWWLMAASYVLAAAIVLWCTNGRLGFSTPPIHHPSEGARDDYPPARIR